MSEQPNFTPDQMNQYAVSRAKSDAELLTKGKLTHNQLGRIALSATQEEMENPGISSERLTQIAHNSIYNVHTQIDAPKTVGQESVFYAPGGAHNTDRGIENLVKNNLNGSSMNEWSGKFSSQGVAEAVTVAKLEDMTDHYLDLAKYAGMQMDEEPVYAVQYATLSNGDASDRYRYEDRGGRPNAFEGFVMLLPESAAKELEVGLKESPVKARELFGILAENPEADISGGSYKKGLLQEHGVMRAPFGQWRQQDGGVSRMAFRTASNQGPSQAEIIEF
jgi:hypothetical protein